MAKRGKFSEVEKFYIQNNPELSESQIAQALDRTEAAVKKVRDSLPAKEAPEPTEADLSDEEKRQISGEEAASRGFKAGHLFARRREATTMTRAASEMGDEASKINREQSKNHRHKESIFRPMGD